MCAKITDGSEFGMANDFKLDNFIDNFSNNCKKVQRKTFSKGQVITTYIQKRNQLCILVNRKGRLSKI